jgi:hypothetical protein
MSRRATPPLGAPEHLDPRTLLALARLARSDEAVYR